MNSRFSKKGLMVALGASVFALSSFTALHAEVCCLDYDREAPAGWMGHPDLNQLGFNTPVFPPPQPFEAVPMERFLSCYMYHFPDRTKVDENSCQASVDKVYRIKKPLPEKGFEAVQVTSAHWYPNVGLGKLRGEQNYLPSKPTVELLATDVELAATKNATGGVDLELTTTAEPDTAALLILRGEKRGKDAIEVTVVCEFPSGGSPYTCTDNVVGDLYQVAEIEYDGSLVIQNKGVKPKK